MNLKVKEGDEITFVAMQWHEEHWEFDFPSVLLEPVIRWHESGMHCHQVIEDALIEAVVDERLKADGVPEFRGTERGLKRIRTMVEKGHKFAKEYEVVKETYRIQKDANGNLEGIFVRHS